MTEWGPPETPIQKLPLRALSLHFQLLPKEKPQSTIPESFLNRVIRMELQDFGRDIYKAGKASLSAQMRWGEASKSQIPNSLPCASSCQNMEIAKEFLPQNHPNKKRKDWGQASCSNKVGSPWWPTFSLPRLTAGKGAKEAKDQETVDRSVRSPLSMPGLWFGPGLPLVSSPGVCLGQRFSKCGQHPYYPRDDPETQFASSGCFQEDPWHDAVVDPTPGGMCHS